MIVWQLSKWNMHRSEVEKRLAEIRSYGYCKVELARRKYKKAYAYCIIRRREDGEDVPREFELNIVNADILEIS